MPHSPHSPFVLAVSDEERAERLEHRCAGRPRPGCRVVRLDRGQALELPRRSVRGLVVLAETDTPYAETAARMCWDAHEKGIPVVLVRFGTVATVPAWPLHPADAVVDVTDGEAALFEEVLARSFADERPRSFPLVARCPADVVLVTGDPRPRAFESALSFAQIFDDVVMPRNWRNAHETETRVLWFRPRRTRADTTARHPLERHALPHDPHRYEVSIEPLDDLELRARAIASLHATHGDWSATRRLVADCAVASPAAQARLLSRLGMLLAEPRARTWAGLCSLAGEAAAATDDRRPRLFPHWVAPALRTGLAANGLPREEQHIDHEMAHVDQIRERAVALARMFAARIDHTAEDDLAKWRARQERRARRNLGHDAHPRAADAPESLIREVLKDERSMVRSFFGPDHHDEAIRDEDTPPTAPSPSSKRS